MTMARDTTILIMAGGTGGHVFPALAVAQYLRERGVAVQWLGTRRGLEADVVPKAGFSIHYISISGLRGKGLLSWALAPFRLVVAVAQALRLVRRCRPAAVLGMGGFVTGPGGVASRLLGRPLVIHEQNAIAGLTNRLLSVIAQRVLEAFPGSFVARRQAEVTGNPVRDDIAALAPPAQRFAARGAEPLRLLVLGGSLGAQALNETVPAALARLAPDARPLVRHQTGQRTHEAAREAYRQAGVQAEVTPFIADMASAYAWADLVLCRAGALTIAELAAAGVGSILVPYPHAVDDHQTHNAAYLIERDAARRVPQAELNAASLASLLGEFLGPDRVSARARLLEMAQRARASALPEATHRVAQICLEVAHG